MAIKIEMPRGGADGAPAVDITTTNEAIKIEKEETKKEVSFSVEIDEVTETQNGLAKPNDKKVLDTTIFDADTFRSGASYDTAQDAWNTAIAPQDTIGKYRHINGTELAWRDKDGKTRKSRYISTPRISKDLQILSNWNNIQYIPEWGKFFASAQTYDGTNRGYLRYAMSDNGQDWTLGQYDVVEMWGRSAFGNGKLVVTSWFKTEQIAVFDGTNWETKNLQGISNNYIWTVKYINEQFVFLTTSARLSEPNVQGVEANNENNIVILDKDLNYVDSWSIFTGTWRAGLGLKIVFTDIEYREGFYYLSNQANGFMLKADNINAFKSNVYPQQYGSAWKYVWDFPNAEQINTTYSIDSISLQNGYVVGGRCSGYLRSGNDVVIINDSDVVTAMYVPYAGDTYPRSYTQPVIVGDNDVVFFADTNGYIYWSEDWETWEYKHFDVEFPNFGEMIAVDGYIYILSGGSWNEYLNTGSTPEENPALADICYKFDPEKKEIMGDYWQDMPVLSVPTDGILASVSNEFKTAELDAYLRYRDNTLGAVVRDEPYNYLRYPILLPNGYYLWCKVPLESVKPARTAVFSKETGENSVGWIMKKNFNPNNPYQVEIEGFLPPNNEYGTFVGEFQPTKNATALATTQAVATLNAEAQTEKALWWQDYSLDTESIDLNKIISPGIYNVPSTNGDEAYYTTQADNVPTLDAGWLGGILEVVSCNKLILKTSAVLIVQKFYPYEGENEGWQKCFFVRTGKVARNSETAVWQDWVRYTGV